MNYVYLRQKQSSDFTEDYDTSLNDFLRVFHITHEFAKKDLEQKEDEKAKLKHHQEEEQR